MSKTLKLTIYILSILAIQNSFAQNNEIVKIEKEYLEMAKVNIEKYRKGNINLQITDSLGKPLERVKIEINQISQDFLFGALLFDLVGFGQKKDFNEQAFKSLFKSVFNFGVLPFYWNDYENQQGKPKWERMKNAIDWSVQNGITLKGHPLAWTHIAGTPTWMKGMPVEMTKDLLKTRIYNNVAGFKEHIKIWDVVNEPVTALPWDIAVQDTTRNESGRYQVKQITQSQIVPWVNDAFHWAYQANKEGNFILNEFYQIAKPTVREKFYNLVKELQQKQMPLSGIGLQAHEPHEMWFSPIELYKTLDLYQDFNLPIHITEFTPQSSGKSIVGWREGEIWTEQAQADFAQQFYMLAFSHPKVVSINWWGFSDNNSWLKGGGLINKDNQPKPVYNILKKLIKEQWMSKNIQGISDKKGQFTFRGFGGNYEAKAILPNGKVQNFYFHLSENQDQNQIFRVLKL